MSEPEVYDADDVSSGVSIPDSCPRCGSEMDHDAWGSVQVEGREAWQAGYCEDGHRIAVVFKLDRVEVFP